MTSTPFEEFVYELRIPRDRVAVLIGKSGEIKRNIESSTRTKMDIDSKEGLVVINGNDALLLYLAREVVRAVGRGFNPDIALDLLKQDYGLEIIPIMDFARNQNDLGRLRGRVIGEKGKSRNTIESLTDTRICVYGKTVAIIGPYESIPDARRAVVDLLSGATHAAVYRWLEKKRRSRRDYEEA